eukprot:CAMPEP_0170543266 /NCGR_PEP_ID=MMETSP0211-20121228/2441_1 /TAXON_ID=311385 /ORGANISM="Pseudokeronopsis sp., Strain OXSARD2" /LENGTH=73 /DNA_ID=CAMNT_0010846591 /DNA_START=685 /DNA_END=901 /DNA_ORIENTATION=+
MVGKVFEDVVEEEALVNEGPILLDALVKFPPAAHGPGQSCLHSGASYGSARTLPNGGGRSGCSGKRSVLVTTA